MIAIVAAAMHAPLVVQVILFFVVAAVLLYFTRPWAMKYFNKDRVKTNVESLIGRQAIVTEDIDNLQAVGRATVGGQEWSARSSEPDGKIETGAVVTIVSIDGVKLIVKPEKQTKKSEK